MCKKGLETWTGEEDDLIDCPSRLTGGAKGAYRGPVANAWSASCVIPLNGAKPGGGPPFS